MIEHLLYSEKLPPSAITLIGDSAGAHLLLSLVLHLSHPNPAVSPLKTEGSFAGVVLISPWVDMNSSTESITSNRRKDLLGAVALAYWAHNFFGDSPPDLWNTALMAPDEWWATVPAKEIVVTYGDDELLRDDAAMLCDKIKVSWKPVYSNLSLANSSQTVLPSKSNYTEFSWRSSRANGHESILPHQ